MVFQSLPLYVDPPNWPQQANQQHTVAGADQNSQLPPQVPPPAGGPASAGSIKPGSMAQRARLAKIPQPESALKCPRCDSTNTKFCYFNNYSLSQPRHFCKTCKRYWTRGGALRNVPVGGGCRRNKRSKANRRSKSPVLVKTGSGSNFPSNELTSDSCTTGDVIHLPPSTQLPILPPLHHLGDFNSADIGLNFCGIQAPASAVCGGGVEYPISSSGGGFLEQWKLQQFPLISNLDTTTGLYPLEAGGVENSNYIGQLRWLKPGNGEGVNQVKMEGNSNIQGLALSRNLLGSLTGSNDQYWSSNTNAWTDLPGFTSSSTGHLM